MVAFVIMFSGGFAKGLLRLLIAAIVFRAGERSVAAGTRVKIPLAA